MYDIYARAYAPSGRIPLYPFRSQISPTTKKDKPTKQRRKNNKTVNKSRKRNRRK